MEKAQPEKSQRVENPSCRGALHKALCCRADLKELAIVEGKKGEEPMVGHTSKAVFHITSAVHLVVINISC